MYTNVFGEKTSGHLNKQLQQQIEVGGFFNTSPYKQSPLKHNLNASNQANCQLNTHTASSSTSSVSSYSKMNSLINMASEIGDDWGSLNNYLTNFLRKPSSKDADGN